MLSALTSRSRFALWGMRISAGTTAINTSGIRRTRSPYLGNELREDFSFGKVFTLDPGLRDMNRPPRRIGHRQSNREYGALAYFHAHAKFTSEKFGKLFGYVKSQP